MADTVLGFMDFFWIWWIIVVATGGSRLVGGDTSDVRDQLSALEKQITALTEEIRSLKGGTG